MKKISTIATGAVLGVLLFGASVSAADSAAISNTGPGSTNTITIKDKCSVSVTNNNNVDVTNNNQQNAGSGNASSSGNTSGGSATSGSASNSSSTNVGVNITNGPVTGCGITQTTTPNVPTTPGRGGGGQVSGMSKTAAATQVQAPVGGVDAGAGGLSGGILVASVLSGGLGLYRLKKQIRGEA